MLNQAHWLVWERGSGQPSDTDQVKLFMTASCLDFRSSLTLEEALATGTMLAFRLNGQPLPEEHGGPCRLVAASKTGPHFVKLPERIEVTLNAPEG